MIMCENKELPEIFQGFKTTDLLKTWEEIQAKGTKAPEDQIAAMRNLLRQYKLGLFNDNEAS